MISHLNSMLSLGQSFFLKHCSIVQSDSSRVVGTTKIAGYYQVVHYVPMSHNFSHFLICEGVGGGGLICRYSELMS